VPYYRRSSPTHTRIHPVQKYDPTAPRLRAFPGARAWDTTNPWIYMGSLVGLRKAQKRRGALVCPLDSDPLSWSWPAQGLAVMVIGDEDKPEPAERLTRALLRDGARLVACVLAPKGETYYRYSNEGVET